MSDDEVAAPQPCPKKRKYTQRLRTGANVVTVPVQGIFTSKPLHICRKAAEYFIGVGSGRINRVLHGLADGRAQEMRLPRNEPTSAMSICLSFL